MSQSGIEKRQHPRLELFSAAMVVIGEEGHLTEVQDVSAGGARLSQPTSWHYESLDRCMIFFIFDQDTIISMRASLVRATGTHIAFRFDDGQEDKVEQMLYESRFSDEEGAV